ncbi:MAG: hypothetical protein R2845_01200 [Thermomicrobiales bacterium]
MVVVTERSCVLTRSGSFGMGAGLEQVQSGLCHGVHLEFHKIGVGLELVIVPAKNLLDIALADKAFAGSRIRR